VAGADQRPDVVAARRRGRAAEHSHSAATWDLLAPKLTAELRQSYVSDELGGFGGRTSYGALLLWTISEEKLGRLSEASALATRERLLAEQARERATGEVLDARQGVAVAARQIPLAKQRLDAAERAWRISLARLQDGTGSALEVFETQDDVARARLGLARAIVTFNQAQVRLLAAAGVLEPSRLAP
jgi:outer membrane protein TolC